MNSIDNLGTSTTELIFPEDWGNAVEQGKIATLSALEREFEDTAIRVKNVAAFLLSNITRYRQIEEKNLGTISAIEMMDLQLLMGKVDKCLESLLRSYLAIQIFETKVIKAAVSYPHSPAELERLDALWQKHLLIKTNLEFFLGGIIFSVSADQGVNAIEQLAPYLTNLVSGQAETLF